MNILISGKFDLAGIHQSLRAIDSNITGVSFDDSGIMSVEGGVFTEDQVRNAASANPAKTKVDVKERLRNAIDNAIIEPGISPKIKDVLVALRAV